MKKWNFLFMALLMSAAVMVTSCGGDDDEPIDKGPTITLKGGTGYTSTDDTVNVNSAIKVGISGTKSTVSGKKLTNFKFYYIANNVPTTLIDSTFKPELDTFTWETELTFSFTGKVKLYFELTDKNGMKNDQSFEMVIIEPGTAIKKWENVEFGSYNDAVGSFFSSTEGFTYTVAQTSNSPANQAKVDFLYFYGATNKNAMASPDNPEAISIPTLKLNLWTTKNQTRFNPSNLTAGQFNSIGASYQFPTFDVGSQSTIVNKLDVGKIFMFKTKSNKLGLVMITQLSTRGDTAKATVLIQN